MNLAKFNPWNWFKHEDEPHHRSMSLPIEQRGSNTAVASDPFSSFLELHRQMDNLFDNAFRSFGLQNFSQWQGSNAPPVSGLGLAFKPNTDVAEDDHQYHISVDVPGMKESDLSIELNDHVLTIRGEKETKVENDDRRFYRVERHYGSFQRTLALPEDAVIDDISAQLNDGVLTLSVPRKSLPGKAARRITIES